MTFPSSAADHWIEWSSNLWDHTLSHGLAGLHLPLPSMALFLYPRLRNLPFLSALPLKFPSLSQQHPLFSLFSERLHWVFGYRSQTLWLFMYFPYLCYGVMVNDGYSHFPPWKRPAYPSPDFFSCYRMRCDRNVPSPDPALWNSVTYRMPIKGKLNL